MTRDPFYRDIETRLRGKLDPDLFERCAADLLRRLYPGLVPIRGGDDGGMDGAVADGNSLPFPLVTTTGTNVSSNLQRSLKSYLKRGGTQRKVVFATSRFLTARRRTHLEKAASELEFTLLQIHDGGAFADLLYRDPNWCRELLELTGAPPPLSIMPQPTRPLLGNVLVGRSSDLNWLSSSEDDLLLVGQPGCGKTFLLYHFAKQEGALFVHTLDLAEIAAGVRSTEPTALIVEDAHLSTRLLIDLRRLRSEMGAKFRLVADCWLGSRSEVARALDVPSNAVRELELLTRDEIAEIVRNAGIRGPAGLVQEIVNQAEGKPGLATTLCDLWRRGDVRALAQADALAAEIATVFNRVVGSDVMSLLGAFALGGDAGMEVRHVAGYLGVTREVLRDRVSKLADGGVLVEIDLARLAVRPPALRHALVRDVFFRGPAPLPIDALVSVAPDRNETALTIIGAMLRGAQVPPRFIQELVAECGVPDVWAAYAGIGRQQAEWITVHHPEWAPRIGRALLQTSPEVAIPLLMNAAVGDDRALHSHPDHGLRQIQDWVISGWPGAPDALERRRELLSAALRWRDGGGAEGLAVRALALSLSPKFERSDTEPGSGRVITLSHGLVSLEDARSIRALWPQVRAKLDRVDPKHLGPLRDLAEDWAFPGRMKGGLGEPFSVEARAFALEILHNLCDVAGDHSGVIHWARSLSVRLGAELHATLDPVFETLFPIRELEDWQRQEQEQAERAIQLADCWVQTNPADTIPTLVEYENEARLVGQSWPRWSPFVCQRIAERVDNHELWAEGLLDGSASVDLVQPFVRKLLPPNTATAVRVIKRCLDDEKYQLATAITILACEGVPAPLVEASLAGIKGGGEWIRTLCSCSELAESIVRLLLVHPDDAIASAAAVGEWAAAPEGIVRESLQREWEQAILRCSGDEYSLPTILRADPALCTRWISRVLRASSNVWRYDDTITALVRDLKTADRRALMSGFRADRHSPEIMQALVGPDLGLYSELLQDRQLARVHLAPLIGHPDMSDWVCKAQIALDSGYSVDDVVRAALSGVHSWVGHESDMWKEWAHRFDELKSHADDRIRRIGTVGRSAAAERCERALTEERAEAVRGF